MFSDVSRSSIYIWVQAQSVCATEQRSDAGASHEYRRSLFIEELSLICSEVVVFFFVDAFTYFQHGDNTHKRWYCLYFLMGVLRWSQEYFTCATEVIVMVEKKRENWAMVDTLCLWSHVCILLWLRILKDLNIKRSMFFCRLYTCTLSKYLFPATWGW